jgi:endonuclease/exonuclease/phosphatase family metal-dependent hydrolase
LSSLSFASFNSHFGLAGRGGAGRGLGGRGQAGRHSAYDVVDVCRRLDTDVIALQEVFTPRGAPGFAVEAGRVCGYQVYELPLAPARVTGRARIVRGHDGEEGEGMWGLALLLRLDSRRLPDISLGHALADPAPRGALAVEVDVGGQKVMLATAHVSHRPHGSVLQLRRLQQALSTGVDSPAVLAGDMNMWGPIVSGCFPDWRRAVLGPTWPAHRPHSQIDHILVRGPIELIGGRVCEEEGSDHRPIRVALKVH